MIEADGESLGSLWAQADGPVGLPSRGRDAEPVAGRRPARPGDPARAPRRAGHDGRGRPSERCPEERPAGLRVPRPAHARWRRFGRSPEVCSTKRCRCRRPRSTNSAATIDDEALRLSDIVRGLLDLSRIEAGELKPDLALHDLGELVETVVRRYRTAEGGHEVRVEIPEDLPVLVDALFFDQALTNVYDNALAHSGPSSVIRIAARPANPDGPDDPTPRTRNPPGHRSSSSSRTTAPGLDPARLEQVFDKFYRGQGVETGSRHGLGIGLTIARGLTEAMGARIEAGPSELGGLAITFRLSSGQ